jgi:hypothetical protein
VLTTLLLLNALFIQAQFYIDAKESVCSGAIISPHHVLTTLLLLQYALFIQDQFYIDAEESVCSGAIISPRHVLTTLFLLCFTSPGPVLHRC